MHRPTSPDHPLGIGLIIASVILVSCSDTVAKLMTAHVPVMQIALIQSVTMMLAVPLLVRSWHLPSIVATRRPGLQMVRSLCQLGSALCFFTGLRHLPLADIVAIIFIGPLLIVVLSALWLHESVEPARWIACTVGFLGALIVVRPGFGTIGWTALYPIAATTLYAVYVICTRAIAQSERNGTMLFYGALASVLVLGLMSPAYWVTPVGAGWLGLLTIGTLSCASAALAIRAYSLAPASLLAPYNYVEIVTAILFGILVFGDVPDGFTILGASIVVASGIYVFRHESPSPPA